MGGRACAMRGGAVHRPLAGVGARSVRRTLQPLAVLLVALVVVAALAVAIALPPSDNGDPSSRSAGKLGTLALYTWLGRLGLSVSRLSGTFDLGATDVLVDYEPSVHFSAPELDSIMRLVRGGGDLVLVFDARSIDTALPLLQRIGVEVSATLPPGTATPAQPFDPADRVHTVPRSGGVALLEQTPLVSLLRSGGRTVAGGVRGGGRDGRWPPATRRRCRPRRRTSTRWASSSPAPDSGVPSRSATRMSSGGASVQRPAWIPRWPTRRSSRRSRAITRSAPTRCRRFSLAHARSPPGAPTERRCAARPPASTA